MQSTIFNNIRVQNSINFRNLFDSDNIYFWFANQGAWTDENNPPLSEATDKTTNEVRSDIVMLARLEKTDTALGIQKNTWTYNTVYTEYAYDEDLYTKQFYVITADNNVYKCLDNNGGAPSLYTPLGTSTNTLVLGDGYQWKFMYNLSIAMAGKFLVNGYIPVPYDSTQKTTFQVAVETQAVGSSTTPIGGHGKNQDMELGARNIIIAKDIVIDNVLFTVPDYRQFGIIINPLLTSGLSATADYYHVGDSLDTVNISSGNIITLTNHQLVSTTADDIETLGIVINF